MKLEDKFNISNNSLKKFRYFCLFMLLIDNLLLLKSKETFYLYLCDKHWYFTNWCHMLTTIYFFLSIFFENHKNIANKLASIFHVVWACEFFVTFIYWVKFHSHFIQQAVLLETIILSYTTHINPLLFLTIDFFFNNLNLRNSKHNSFKLTITFFFIYVIRLGIIELMYEMNLYKDITYRGFLKRYLHSCIYF